MGVDHGRAHVGVAEQALHGAYVGARLQQMRGERMAQGVHRGRLGDGGRHDRGAQIALQALLVNVVAMQRFASRILGHSG